MDKGPSVGDYVARSLDIIDRSGIAYKLNPMGTVIEGDWDECMNVVKACYERMKQDCARITCSLKIDYREGQSGRIESKMKRIEKVLDRAVKH